jgi:nitrite reductase (NADH) small subunit
MTALADGPMTTTRWASICRLELLQPGRGVAALLGDRQVALFRVAREDGPDAVYAIGNYDPCGGASVLSRGIVGDRGGEPVVASPLYKQAFSLVTGQCVDDPSQEVPVYRVSVANGWVRIEAP